MMTKANQNIYIAIRAEQIKHFHDTENGSKLLTPYSLERAKAIATQQLEADLHNKHLRISLEELLLCNNDTCINIVETNLINRFKTNVGQKVK